VACSHGFVFYVSLRAEVRENKLRRITALLAQRRHEDRVNVYLDGEYAFPLKAIVAARLSLGQSLSLEEIEGLVEESAFEENYDKALGFLSYRPRSSAEVRRYLDKKKTPPRAIEKVVERLDKAGLLDDLSFARFWVENRERFRPRSARMLRYELGEKGIEEAVITQVLENQDEEEGALRAAQQVLPRYSNLERQEFRRKLGSYLARRGFAYPTIDEVLDRLWAGLRKEGDTQ